MIERLRARAHRPTDVASLAALRVLFGLLMVGALARYFVNGWVDAFYVQPTFTFQYWGFGWVRPLPEPFMSGLFIALILAAALIALGLFYRVAAPVFFLGFTYVTLLDVTRYLNHYYLVVLLAALFAVLPLHAAWSLDARRDPALAARTVPAWMLWVVRFQVGVVYVFAGLAKVGPDWLLHAQPLTIWLGARTELPVLGPLFELPWMPLAMSWAGCLYDLTIVGWLSWRRTRPYAFAVLCAFHLTTHLLFYIGIFPLVMTVAATVFFEPDWPRRLARRLGRVLPDAGGDLAARWRVPAWGAALLAAYVGAQLLVPLRVYLYAGDHLWHEQGMRWGWRVMLHEKNGTVRYRVRFDGRERELHVAPRDYLTVDQAQEFSAQPDLILQLAHHIRDDYEARGRTGVEVRVDAWAALNGRPSARLIDPDVDLARVEDGLAPAAWILPAPPHTPRQQLAEAR